MFKSIRIVDYMTTAIGMAAAGLGFTVCPGFATPFVKSFGLEMRQLRNPEYRRNVFAFTSSVKSPSPLVDAFVKALTDHFQGHPEAR